LQYLKSRPRAAMHNAFDVGMHNKRLSLVLAAKPPPRVEAQPNNKEVRPVKEVREVRKVREVREVWEGPPGLALPVLRPGRAAVLGVAAYALVVASDYVHAGLVLHSPCSSVPVLAKSPRAGRGCCLASI